MAAAASIGFVSPSTHPRIRVSRSGLGFVSVRCCSSSAVEDHVECTSSSSFLRNRPKSRFFSVPTATFRLSPPFAMSRSPAIYRIVGMGSKLVGCGSAVPKIQFSNDDLAQIVETSDEWISVRTGIRNRRVLTGNETLNGLVEAARGALQMAEVEAENVDLIILCSSTPDDLFGGAARIQEDLGCRSAWAFDITAACSGFVVGLITASHFIKGGGYKNILVIGADALSRFVDWTDRGTCILFGDAAGAILVQACSGDKDGLLGFDVYSDGSGQRHLNATAKDEEPKVISSTNGAPLFPPRKSSYSCIQMNGKEVSFCCLVRATVYPGLT